MQSTVYPNIIFVTNQNLTFLGTSIAQRQQLNVFHPTNPLNAYYAELMDKLFSQIKIIKEMLWIGKVPSTQVIRIYFSEPYQYPIAKCCRRPVFVEVENHRCGTVFCSQCSRAVMKFVKAGKGPDEQIFKNVQQQMKTRKNQLRSLLTSLKFRGRKLRNNYLGDMSTNQNDIVIEINDQEGGQVQDNNSSAMLPSSLMELKEIISDIFA